MRPLVVGLLALAACAGPTNGEVAIDEGDPGAFAADVQPILRSCASLDCHGVPGRPLRLYALYGLRRAPGVRGEPATAEELAANMAAISAIEPARVLGKPLRVGAGGMQHVGGDLWSDEAAPEYVCVSAYLAGDARPAACDEAIAATPY